MNVRSKLSLPLTAALLLVGSVLTIFASSPPQPAFAAATLPYHVEPNTTASSEPGVKALTASETMIVWQDERSGTPDIYAYDLVDGREFRVARTGDVRSDPDVDGPRIVWVEGANPAQRTIQGYDLSEGGPFTVTGAPAEVADPAISGDVVIWREKEADGWHIQAKNIATNNTTALPTKSPNVAHPAISGSTAVWQEYSDGHWSLVQYDLQSEQRTVLTTSNADEMDPAIDGSELVFLRQAQTGGTAQLVARDLTSAQERVIVADHIVTQPSVSGGVVVWEDWRSGLPDVYAYDIGAQVMYAIARSQQAFDPAVSQHYIAWISRSDTAHGRVQVVSLVPRLPTDPQDPPAVPSADNVYFPQTHHFMSSGFKTFWQGHGGAEILGYPLTEEFSEKDPTTGEQITVQYFQRAKLEYRASAPEGQHITVALLGLTLTADRNFPKVDPVSDNDNTRYFPETGHTISLGFKDFWEANGGLAAFGYPISEEFTENGRTVQYFQRARFEYNPNSDNPDSKVTLGLLGQEALERLGLLPMPSVDTTQLTP